MYMAMIGMAIVAVPRGVFKAIAWVAMGVVGWLVTGVESAYAAVTYGFSSGTLDVYGDTNSNTISVYASGDSVLVYDGINSPSVVSGVEPGDVTALRVFGGAGHDQIDVPAVTESNGFDALGGVTLQGDAGNDTITGRDEEFGDDYIDGGDDDDCLMGRNGWDTIVGGDGADELYGGPGNDDLYHYTTGAEEAADFDTDALFGGTGNDFAYWNSSNDDDVLGTDVEDDVEG